MLVLQSSDENEPLVPAQTSLLLTTNGTLVPNASEDDPLGLEVNTSAFALDLLVHCAEHWTDLIRYKLGL